MDAWIKLNAILVVRGWVKLRVGKYAWINRRIRGRLRTIF